MKKLTKEAAASIAEKIANSVFGEKIEGAKNLLQSKTNMEVILRTPGQLV